MINSSRFFITRIIVVLFITIGFICIVYYNENKNNPTLIETIENFKIDYIYNTSSKYFDEEDLKSTVESLNKIFPRSIIEGNTALISIEPGKNHNIVFNYTYTVNVDTNNEKKMIDHYKQNQKLKFCNNQLDIKRLKHLTQYDFTYNLNGTNIIEFSLNLNDCIN